MPAEKSIFVSIACLSDPDVIATVRDLFAKAANPERVFVGICLQIDPGDVEFQTLLDIHNTRIDLVNFEDALGPIYARARCERLMDDEDFYFQIDCHSRFFKNWDKSLIEQLEQAEKISERAVLSHYPINIRNMENSEYLANIGQVNRFRQVDADSIKSHGSLIKMPEEPLNSIGISAAMLFMRGSVKHEIPYDPNLHFGLHAAEQVLYAARLWTHGYDIFTPTCHTVATEYEGARDRIPEYVKKECNRNRKDWPLRTWSKVKYLLQLDTLEQVDPVYREELRSPNFAYGMGTGRALAQYYQYAKLHEQLLPHFPRYVYRES